MATIQTSGPVAMPRVVIRMEDGPLTNRRVHAQCLNEANYKTAELHWTRHVPWHFEGFAASKYSYAKRSRFWREWKEQHGLSTTDFVATGVTQQEVTKFSQITSTQYGAKLKLVASLAGMSGRFRLKEGQTSLSRQQEQLAMRKAELEQVANDEGQYLARANVDFYLQAANARVGRMVVVN